MKRTIAEMPYGVIYTDEYSAEEDGIDKINYARECRKNYIKHQKNDKLMDKKFDKMLLREMKVPSGFGIHLKTDNLYTIYDKHN